MDDYTIIHGILLVFLVKMWNYNKIINKYGYKYKTID